MHRVSPSSTDHQQHLLDYAADNGITLSLPEESRTRQQVEKIIRQQTESRRPDPAHYALDTGSKTAQFIAAVLNYSKIAVPIIALLAAVASAVRTVQTASEIYTASGSHPIGVAIAAIGFTISAEFALFALALARENQHLQHQRTHQRRHVTSLASLLRAIKVRLGVAEPLTHDELPERDGLGMVMLIALVFTVTSNAFIGLRPLLREVGASSLQSFVIGLWDAPAQLQLTFIVDMVAVIFPPLMALKAGHLTARFAAEASESATSASEQYERDMGAWYAAMSVDPFASDEGQALLQDALQRRLIEKVAKRYEKAVGQVQPSDPFAPQRLISSNGARAAQG